jgi:hypothetical protein
LFITASSHQVRPQIAAEHVSTSKPIQQAAVDCDSVMPPGGAAHTAAGWLQTWFIHKSAGNVVFVLCFVVAPYYWWRGLCMI